MPIIFWRSAGNAKSNVLLVVVEPKFILVTRSRCTPSLAITRGPYTRKKHNGSANRYQHLPHQPRHSMIGEPVMTASSARCSNCPAWVILHASRTTHISAGTYQFSCPVEGCGAVTQFGNDQPKLFQIPESWFSRGYFYENELREISDAWTPSGSRSPL